MTEIYSLYNKVSQDFADLYSEVNQLREKSIQMVESSEEHRKSQISDLNSEIDSLRGVAQKLKVYIAIASQYSGNTVEPQAPETVNLSMLSVLQVQINTKSKDDGKAKELYTRARAQLLYVGMEFATKTKELEIATKQAEDATVSSSNYKNIADMRLNSIINSGSLVRLYSLLRENYLKFASPEGRLEVGNCEYIDLGMMSDKLYVLPEHRSKVKAMLQEYYDENTSQISIPLQMHLHDRNLVVIKHSQSKKELVDNGVFNLISNCLRCNNRWYEKVFYINSSYVADHEKIHIEDLRLGYDTCLEFVSGDASTVHKKMVEIFGDIDRYRYKSDFSNRILVVLNTFPEGYDISLVEKVREIFHDNENVDFIIKVPSASENNLVTEVCDKSSILIKCLDEGDSYQNNRFSWHKKNISFETRKKQISNKIEVANNDYSSNVGFEWGEYKKGNRNITDIPYGIDQNGNITKFDFEGSNFATFVSGASRSGKSNLLHILLTGIIRTIHPDDVEIWLIDFKMTEFSRYVDNTPPHVRYILLDESPDLIFDIIDRMTEVLYKRQNIFMGKYDKLSEVPKERYMPSMLFVIDEFSIMSNILSESESYRRGDYVTKLQTLLAKGAALGMHFIFSSQGFTSGSRGLSELARKQVQQRVSLKTDYNEILSTLDVHQPSETDTILMRTLEVYRTLTKVDPDYDGNQLLLSNVLCINNADEQKAMIGEMQSEMNAVAKFEPNNPKSYIDKQLLVKDGKSYIMFADEYSRIASVLNNISKSDVTELIIGEPRRMKKDLPITISLEYGDNILLLYPTAEESPMVSILASICCSLEMQDKSAELWIRPKHHLNAQIDKVNFSELRKRETLEDIGAEVNRIRTKIENWEEDRKFIIISGLDALLREYRMAGERENAHTQEGVRMDDLKGDGDLFLKLGISSGELNNIHDDVNLEDTYFDKEMGRTDSNDVENYNTRFEGINSDVETDISMRDIADNLQFIIEQGPSLGYHFILLLHNVGEFKQCELNSDLFKHLIVFRMPSDDAFILGDSTLASFVSILPNRAFIYSNGVDYCSYRPYLHAGCSWDGFSADGMDIFDEKDDEYLL